MRHLLVAITVCGLLTGCAPTWFQDFKKNPVQQTDIVLDQIASIQQVAIVVFSQLKPLLPADKQPVFQQKFDGSIVALNKAMDAVRAAVKAAADAQVENPDLSQVIADVVTAADAVRAVIAEVRDLLKAPPVSAAPGAPAAAPALVNDPIGYAELGTMVDALKK